MYRSLFIALLLAFPAAATAQSNTASPAAVTVDSAGWLAIGGVSIIQLRDKSSLQSLSDRSSRTHVPHGERTREDSQEGPLPRHQRGGAPTPAPRALGELLDRRRRRAGDEGDFRDAAANDQKPDKLAAAYAEQFRKALRRIYTP